MSGLLGACASEDDVEFAQPPEGTRELCVESAEYLRECGEAVTEMFYPECERELAFGEGCADDCDASIQGCYAPEEQCQTVEDINSCVSSRVNFEACLCE